jgi:hypothetical protein
MAAVAVLVVIAIAGIVLTGLRGRAPSGAGAIDPDTTRGGAPGLTPPVPIPPGEAEAGPNQLVFAPKSSLLSLPAIAKLERIAKAAKAETRSVLIALKIEIRGDRDEQSELANKRVSAVRQVLEENGIPTGAISWTIAEMPKGLVTVPELNRADLILK